MQLIDKKLFDKITGVAKESQRKRKNENIHTAESAPCQRLLNAIEPESYVGPHCHAHPDKDETIIAVRGKIGVIFFDADGKIAARAVIAAGGSVVGVNIPHGQFHTMVALESGSVFFEAKAGPYQPIQPNERAAWAPAEGSPEAAAYFARLKAEFAG
ncbi:MAG: cupin fold metalloprotein, WbuC family [Verrucomicrobia bacterium]|nr:cupin fold metalloprotein, WbuC family [Verrucomicrobiota bacterium]